MFHMEGARAIVLVLAVLVVAGTFKPLANLVSFLGREEKSEELGED